MTGNLKSAILQLLMLLSMKHSSLYTTNIPCFQPAGIFTAGNPWITKKSTVVHYRIESPVTRSSALLGILVYLVVFLSFPAAPCAGDENFIKGEITVAESPACLMQYRENSILLTIGNTGGTGFPCRDDREQKLYYGYQISCTPEESITFERTVLLADALKPGEKITLPLTVFPRNKAGEYYLNACLFLTETSQGISRGTVVSPVAHQKVTILSGNVDPVSLHQEVIIKGIVAAQLLFIIVISAYFIRYLMRKS